MEVIIVGAGIGGLSTALALAQAGHHVTIFESAAELAEVGAGVQMTPNATKWFWKWGLGPDLLTHSALPEAFNIRRDKDGEILGSVPFGGFTEKYGAPYIVIHRADIHRILHEHAVDAGVKIRLNSRVSRYGFEDGSIVLQDGSSETADLVLAMDGINSSARQSFLPETGRGLETTGWAAYRVMAPVWKLKNDPRTADLVSEHTCNCWVGDRRLVMTYMIQGSEWLNIALSHPNDIDTSSWSPDHYRAELQKEYGDWDPCVAALLEHASTNIQNWPIEQVVALRRWTSDSGKFALAGDAAHAMAFYLSMGVSMAVEDAAAICECLSLHQNQGIPLNKAFGMFEKVRKQRAEAMRDASLHAGNILQMPPGPARNARDRAFASDGRSAGDDQADQQFYTHRNSYGIADEGIRDWCYGYDVVETVRKMSRKLGHDPT
jgi:salicylate hydroxylase